MAGKEDQVVASEAAPSTLLDKVQAFLVTERAAIRADARDKAVISTGDLQISKLFNERTIFLLSKCSVGAKELLGPTKTPLMS